MSRIILFGLIISICAVLLGCGLNSGKKTEEETVPEIETQAAETVAPETEVPENDVPGTKDSGTAEPASENYVYMGSLSKEAGDGNISSVEIGDGKITISGSIYSMPENEFEGSFDGDLQNTSYTFPFSDNVKFYLSGGDAGEQECDASEFDETAQLYNGLGLILYVEGGEVTKAEISS